MVLAHLRLVVAGYAFRFASYFGSATNRQVNARANASLARINQGREKNINH